MVFPKHKGLFSIIRDIQVKSGKSSTENVLEIVEFKTEARGIKQQQEKQQ